MDTSVHITVDIQVDLDKIGRDIGKNLAQGLRDLTEQAYEEWKSLANAHLRTTRDRYANSIHMVMKSDTESEISLYSQDKGTNWLITAMERGVKSFSMVEGHMKGHAADHWSTWHKTKPGQKKKNPPFVDIPFKETMVGNPKDFRRMHPQSQAWIHPGFRPIGSGGKKNPNKEIPLRPKVIEFIRKTAPEIIQQAIARVVA